MPVGDGTLYANTSDTSRDFRQHCPWCCDEGVLPGGTERTSSSFKGVTRTADQEVWYPCPMCELGAKKGAAFVWQGRDVSVLVKQCRCSEPPTTRKEGLEALEQTRQAMQTMLGPPDPDAQRRRKSSEATPPASGSVKHAGPGGATVASEQTHHRCPGYNGRNMPWAASQCEFCGEPPTEEITL